MASLASAATDPQLNAPAVSVATIATGLATALEYIPPAAGAISSIIGVFLAVYLVLHRRQQIKIDALTVRKLVAEVELAERALKED